MIKINLLPIEHQETKKTKLPIPEITLVIFLLVVFVWIVALFRVVVLKQELARHKEDRLRVIAQSKDSEVLLTELNKDILPKRTFIEEITTDDLRTAELLNMISDALPMGVWLTDLKVEKEEGKWVIAIEGVARPVRIGSMLSSIGEFVGDVKQNLENEFRQHLKAGPAVGGGETFFDVETSTKRKQAGKIEVTQFKAVYKAK